VGYGTVGLSCQRNGMWVLQVMGSASNDPPLVVLLLLRCYHEPLPAAQASLLRMHGLAVMR
jgi:hypothetical protein